MNNNQNRGAPRGRGQYSGGNRRATRDAQREYNRFNDISYDPSQEVNRRPTQCSQGFSKKGKARKRIQHQFKPSRVLPKVIEDAPRDEPLYDMGPHSSMVAIQDFYCQNFDFPALSHY